MSISFLLNVRRVEFHPLLTEQRHWQALPGSSVLQSVKCVDHSSSAKWRKLWSQTVGIYFLTADGSSPIEIYRRLRKVYGDDSINVSSDAGPVVLREGKRKLVIGPAAADQPRQRQWRPQGKLMR